MGELSGRGPAIAVEPESWRRPHLVDAVLEAGASVVPPGEARALIWAVPDRPDLLRPLLADCPRIDWVQLPFAGIEPYADLLADGRRWTCGKGTFAEPVAEIALTLLLAGFRGLSTYARASRWEPPIGREFRGSRVTLVGGGGIATELIALLRPFGCDVTVVRNRDLDIPGAARVVRPADLPSTIREADAVVLALALTAATRGVMGREQFELMRDDAWLVNVARGPHVVTDDLVAALRNGAIGGAGLDVVDPEPLPDGHPLWTMPNCIVTPHVGPTEASGMRLLARRVTENVRRYAAGERLLGPVEVDLGY